MLNPRCKQHGHSRRRSVCHRMLLFAARAGSKGLKQEKYEAMRRFCVLTLVLWFVAISTPAWAQEGASPRVDEAVERGLAFLARQQNADGSLDGGGPRVARTGRGGMAVL